MKTGRSKRIIAPVEVKDDHLRWGLVTCFWYLAVVKILLLLKAGLVPFSSLTRAAGVHDGFKYLIVAALVIEVLFVFGVWFRKTASLAILCAVGLCFCGAILSVYSLIFKINSNCGCGLLGQNEFFILTQKLVLLAGLLWLYRQKSELSF